MRKYLVIHPKKMKKRCGSVFWKMSAWRRLQIGSEGPYILYDEESGYYYLFVSMVSDERGRLSDGVRSKTVDGEYVDMNGAYPGWDAYGLKLSGNYLAGLNKAYMATGHNSAL